GRDLAPPAEWLRLADAFWDAAMRPDGLRIPPIWGTDAVHGNNNVPGATIFPHNIGLGAARDPALVEAIGRVTALETAVAGQDWSFAPTLAVVRDDRWGRTYEGYSEDPALVASYAGAVVTGLQGAIGKPGFLGAGRVAATAKHFVADGGTEGGRDQGDARVDEATLRDVHAAGYPPALKAGALTVMASFSSWQGVKHHGNRSLLTGVLKERWGFDGVVVGDWNAHGQVPGCSNISCAAAINAGLDLFMAPDGWRDLWSNTVAQAKSGEIAPARLDDAVRRVLRLKSRLGLFDAPRPSERAIAGQFDLLGSAEHRALARRAVRASMVLLKNDGVLPLDPRRRILVAGGAADSIARQSGGWTLSWQGTGVSNADFPNGQSIWSGIDEAVRAAGGQAALSPDGSFAAKPDAAIVVFGEEPYAEFVGDRVTLEYSPSDKRDLETLRKLRAVGVPTVAVFLSGRPMWVNPEINAAGAFVAAFLPGTEGGGVADVLLRDASGRVRHDFTGALSFSWPKRADQARLNRGDPAYDPLFPLGYGLSYRRPAAVPRLSEERPTLPAGPGPLFGGGRVRTGFALALSSSPAVRAAVSGNQGALPGSTLSVAGVDRRAQEDARRLVWSGSAPASVAIEAPTPEDLQREANGELSLVLQYRVVAGSTAGLTVAQRDASGKQVSVPLAGLGATGRDWGTVAVPLRCFATQGLDMGKLAAPFVLTAPGPLTLDVSDVVVASAQVPQQRCGRP
ncbi:MAG TPA: glycoside hydrolase family 3 N-terminal domain-containing protein, partial [Sphingomonas sp.]